MSAEIDVILAFLSVVVLLLFRSDVVLDFLQVVHVFELRFVFETREASDFNLSDFLDDFRSSVHEIVDFREVVANCDIDDLEFRNVARVVNAVVFADLLFDFFLDFFVDNHVFWEVRDAHDPDGVVTS